MKPKIRIALTLAVALMMAQPSFAQLFPNAPWNRSSSASDACPGGVCPIPNTTARGHWTFPGTIESHLGSTHGVDTSGMTRGQMLSTHDALHEGRAPSYVKSAYGTAAPPVVRSGGSTGSASYGSSGGGMAVGRRDIDGALITSIGSTVSPEIAKVGTSEIQALAIGDRVKFRRSLLEAAKRARQSGEITAMEYFTLSAASRNPRVLDKMQAAVHEAAIEDGLATATAIDWDSLIEFIEKLIPIIIKLIDLFS